MIWLNRLVNHAVVLVPEDGFSRGKVRKILEKRRAARHEEAPRFLRSSVEAQRREVQRDLRAVQLDDEVKDRRETARWERSPLGTPWNLK
jgi:hypothetical protein